MTTLTDRPTPVTASELAERRTELPPLRPVRSPRLRAWLRSHRLTLRWLIPIVVGSGLIQAINLGGSPSRIDDEGTYTAQAWAVTHLGALTHYTYWYDHPPLGWLQIAGWTALTDGFARYSVAVVAAREAMVVAALISVVLLWFLSRRVGLGRPAAAAATIIFAVSPLAVQFHRTVYLDNVATPWLLASLLLAMTRGPQLLGFAASAAALGIAILSKETFLLALPLVAWLMWRNAHPQTRRYTLSVAVTLFGLIGGTYVLFALVKGELVPSPNHTSLINGVAFQLGTRNSSGSVLDPNSLFRKTTGEWFQLDPVQTIIAPLAGVAAIFLKRLRPFGIMLTLLVIFMFRPGGYLPVPYVIMLLPLAAIVLAGVTERAIRTVRSRSGVSRMPNLLWFVAVAASAVILVPAWATQLRGLLLADLDAPSRQAEAWVDRNIPKDSRLLVDDSMWVDLVNAGFARDNVIWFYKLDTDTAVKAQSPDGWRDSDYVISTESMRTSPNAASADTSLQNSRIVASFGTGTQKVEVRRIDPAGTAAARQAAEQAQQERADAGSQVAQNPRLKASARDMARLRAGQVDPRIAIVLGAQLSTNTVTVADFPIVPGEAGLPFRQVLVSAIGNSPVVVDGKATSAGRNLLDSISGRYGAQSRKVTSQGLLLTFSVIPPAGLVQ